jgi:hypothetical protein
MKKFMMRLLMGSCMEATMLMAKKEEGRLSFIEKTKLSLHTAMCSFCSKFEKQTCQIAEESKHVHSDPVLSAFAKEKIERMLAGQ